MFAVGAVVSVMHGVQEPVDPAPGEDIAYLHLEYVGPARVFLVAAVDLLGDAPEHDVARQLNELEREHEQ